MVLNHEDVILELRCMGDSRKWICGVDIMVIVGSINL
jgi:hypothetical protein